MKLVLEVDVDEFDVLGVCLQQMQKIIEGVGTHCPQDGPLTTLMANYPEEKFVLLAESVDRGYGTYAAATRVAARMVVTRTPFDTKPYGIKQAEAHNLSIVEG